MSKATIYINGVVGEDVTLLDVIRQEKAHKKYEKLDIIIDSVGGCVDTGKAIYDFLNNLPVEKTTIIRNVGYSIASYIYMVGNNRVIEEGGELMIHLPWVDGIYGGAEKLETVAKELRSIENELVDFYSEHTKINKKTIKQLLENETYLSADEAIQIGFSFEKKLKLKAVALLNNNKNQKEEMTKSKKFFEALNAFFALSEEEGSSIKNLEIIDAIGDIINFPDLKIGDTPTAKTETEEGSKAVDAENKPVEGEIIATNGDVWVFSNGELIEIIEASEEEEEATEEEVTEEVEDEIDLEMFFSLLNNLKRTSEEQTQLLKNQAIEITELKKNIDSDGVIVTPINKKNNTISKDDLPKNLQGLINLRK